MQHGADRADQRWNPIEPDLGARVGDAERLAGKHHGGLQPVDADRLLVADLVLEADVDEVAALDHLLGRLGEPRLVAIDRRDLEKPGQEGDERDQEQERDGTPAARR